MTPVSNPIPVTFLCTCGGGPGILAQVAALRQSSKYAARVLLADFSPASGNLFLPEVDGHFRIPPCTAPDFIPALLRLIERERIDFLYSGLDEEIPVVAAHRAVLEAAGCRVLVPAPDALLAALDKARTEALLRGKVRMPRTVTLDTAFDADRAWTEFDGRVVIKVAASRGGRHVYIPEDREEYDYVLERVRRLMARESLVFLAQECIDGDEFNVTTLHDPAGREIYAFSRRKFETRKVKSTTTAAVVERNDAVIAEARKAVTHLGLIPGFNNVEIIVSHADGLPYMIEVNGGRTAAQDMNVVASGVLITDLMMDMLRGETVTPVAHIPDGLASLKIRRDVIVPFASIEEVPSA
jgi:carbamoyl-phosphate synthase large subunit